MKPIAAQISRIESEHGKEYRVLFKTTDESYDAVEHAIRELHSYELPAIHATATPRACCWSAASRSSWSNVRRTSPSRWT
jgi:hypothetical protein